jgi:hypothetical protein
MATVVSPSGLSIYGPHDPSRKGFVVGTTLRPLYKFTLASRIRF